MLLAVQPRLATGGLNRLPGTGGIGAMLAAMHPLQRAGVIVQIRLQLEPALRPEFKPVKYAANT